VHCAAIVLNIARDKAEEFERGFREHELPTHLDLHERGLLIMSTLSRVDDITTNRVEGALQYLVIAIFQSHEGHTAHDSDPRFKAWNEIADAYQIQNPFVFGGDSLVNTGP
jgi:quinol monooxygenase YgiN